MNASILLRSAFATLAIAAFGVSESSAQLPSLYGTYPTLPAATYVAPLNGGYVNSGYVNNGYVNGSYVNSGLYNPSVYGNSIGVGGCYGNSSVGNSAYWPNYPYGTASNDSYWNNNWNNNGSFPRSNSWNNNGWNSGSQFGTGSDWRWNNNGHHHFDGSHDYRFNNSYGGSNLYRSR